MEFQTQIFIQLAPVNTPLSNRPGDFRTVLSASTETKIAKVENTQGKQIKVSHSGLHLSIDRDAPPGLHNMVAAALSLVVEALREQAVDVEEVKL